MGRHLGLSVYGAAGLVWASGMSMGQVACPTFTVATPAQPLVAGQTVVLSASVQSGARFITSDGTIDIALKLNEAPNTCANFLSYVRSGRYNGVMFHRSVRLLPATQIGVIQSGGYTPPVQPITQPLAEEAGLPASQQPQPIATDPPIGIENAVGNVRGTIGMARTSDPVSATSQFFINTVDNNVDVFGERYSLDANPLDPERPGYSVFGSVTPETLSAVDAIAGLTYFEMSWFFGDAFGAVPLHMTAQNAGYPILPSHFVTISNASVLATPATAWTGGSGWTYRWRRNGADLLDGARVSGSGTGALSIASVTAADFGLYECVVTGVACGSAVSSAVTLSCPADLGRVGGESGADGALDNNDFVSFIGLFFNSDPRADLGRTGGEMGADGAFDNNDFVVFIDRFFDGC